MTNLKHSTINLIIIALLLAGCTAPVTQPGPAATAAVTEQPALSTPASATTQAPEAQTSFDPENNIPLKDAVANLQPQDVFQNFYDITQVPRPSGHDDQIREFLVNFGNGLGLETLVDEAGNVLIRKPASAGMENRQVVVLQAHMDMVPQAAAGKDFDFATEPIQAFVNGDYIITDGTTLGADDGIGMAMIMALLQSKTLQAGPLEALFTVDEETSMSGANGLKPDFLKGRILINLDGEEVGVFTIGSAGGERVNSNFSYEQVPAPADMVSYAVKVEGLQGGHSGVDINKGRGHATKLLVRLLKGAEESYGLRLASIAGGTVSNAIPSDASAVVFLSSDQVDAFTNYVKEFEATARTELAATEPDLAVNLEAVEPPAQVMDLGFQNTLLDALYGTPQGVARMSDTVPGLVETSNNLGVATIQDGQMQLVCYARSSVDSELKDQAQMVASVWELGDFPAEFADRYSGWTPNPDSPILGMMQSIYIQLFDADPTVSAVHAGLECGTIGGIYPEMDMISLGPNIIDVHSPSERLYIPSVKDVMDLVSATLQQIPEQ